MSQPGAETYNAVKWALETGSQDALQLSFEWLYSKLQLPGFACIGLRIWADFSRQEPGSVFGAESPPYQNSEQSRATNTHQRNLTFILLPKPFEGYRMIDTAAVYGILVVQYGHRWVRLPSPGKHLEVTFCLQAR